jgi:stearoyl-CoA desaturase (delta-9 desaturase)
MDAAPKAYVQKKRKPIFSRLKWPTIIYMGLVHTFGLVGSYALISGQASFHMIGFTFITFIMSALGITMGAHRLWAHRSYKAALPVRAMVMLFNSMSNQGTIYHWSRDHRVHHKFSETDADPHNAKRGFFFAHIGWLFVDKDPEVKRAGKMLDFSDLLEDPVVAFQLRMGNMWNVAWCFFIPALYPTIMWGESFYLSFILMASRYLAVLHITWCVNSAAHLWGGHPYDEHSNPAENVLVAIGSMGEGWHNWHHKYPFDYAASEFGADRQFNPTKFVIDALARVGLIWDRKRATNLWAKREAVILKENPGAKSVICGARPFQQRAIIKPVQ